MELWLTAEEVAALLGISERHVRRNARDGKYGEVRYEESTRGGGKGGKVLMIPLAGLPAEAQVRYLREHGGIHVITPTDDGWDQEPEWRRRIASERLEILAAWDRYIAANPGRSKTELTEEFVKTWASQNPENKLSVKTLYRWKKLLREGGRCALLPSWGGAKQERSIDPEALSLFIKMYGTPQQRSIADCYRDLVLVASEHGWRVPSLKTLQRIVSEDFPQSTWILLREGQEAFRQKCEPYLLRDPESIKGCQVWVGDQYTMDLFAKGPNGKPMRPYLTAWLDFRSRKLLGWCIEFRANTDTIMASFASAALDKEIGLPYEIYVDNGVDYSGKQIAYGYSSHRRKTRDKEKLDEARIRSLVYQLGIAPHFAIPANARAKVIEPFFRQVSEKFCKRFETYCGSDDKERPEGLNELLKDPDKVPDLEYVRNLFSDWARFDYNKTVSQGEGRKGESPDETFQRTRLPIRLAPESVMRLCFMPHTQPLTVQNRGVKLFGNWYYTPELVKYVGEKVYLRYRNEDLSKVYVFSLKDEYICDAAIVGRVPAIGISKEDIERHNRLRKVVRKIAKQEAKLREEILAPTPEEILGMRRKAAAASEPEQPKVIVPVKVSKEMLKSAQEVERQVVGNERPRLDPEEERKRRLDMYRENMEFVRIANMKMKKQNGGL